jgi:hypothetical protein
MSNCILCGLPLTEPSREHAIPAWARRAFDIQSKVILDARADESSEDRWRVADMQHLNVTLDDAICKLCNTVWLNQQLEKPLQPVLAPMAVSCKPTVLTVARQALIATWAVKTVFFLELAFRQLYPAGRTVAGYVATAPELAWLRSNTEPPPRTYVWLGCWDCLRETPVMYAPSSAPLPTADGMLVEGHFTTFSLGYLAFQIFSVDFLAAEQHSARQWNDGPPASIAAALPRIWPTPHTEISWPPPAFRNEDWASLVSWDGALRTGIEP